MLPTNTSTATITVAADVTSGGTWATIGKQSNNFSDSGPGNLFAPSGGPFTTTVSQCQQNYVFVQRPVDAERGAAQTVKVQLQLGGQPVPVSDSLTLTALRNGNPVPATTPPVFSGLTASPDTFPEPMQAAVDVLGDGQRVEHGVRLQAGSTISSPTFSIDDGLCPPDTTDTRHLTSTCSLTSDLNGGILESGVTINNHKLPGSIGINFVASSDGAGKCDPWTRASYTAGGQTYYFPGVSLDFDTAAASGLLKVVYRVHNADWVLTDAARGNNDIEICAGARHGDPGRASWNAPNSDPGSSVPVHRKERTGAVGCRRRSLLGRPRLSSEPLQGEERPRGVREWELKDLATGPNGAVEKWRTWTICIPFRLGLEELLRSRHGSEVLLRAPSGRPPSLLRLVPRASRR